MAREIYYQRQNMGGTSIGMPAMPHVQSANTGASQAYAQVAKQGFDLGEKLLGAVIQIENQKQEALAEDAYLNARAEMARWKTQYMQQNQGVDAIEAQQAFERQWGVLSENIRKAYYPQISNNNIKVKLEGNLKLGQLESITSGYQYQDQQKKLWFKDLDDKALLDVDTNVSFDPYNSDFISADINRKVRAWEERYPGRDSTLYRQQLEERAFIGMFNGRLSRGDINGSERLLNGASGLNGGAATYEGIGGKVARFESGNEGVLAIGYDKNGGTSYGLVQVSSRMGSMQEWGRDYLSKTEEGRKAWEHIKSAGPLNTGSRKGAAVDAYLEEAKKNPELFAKTQRQYIQEAHYGPMLRNLPENIRSMIESSPALQEMAWSTAIQHGGAGGRRILERAYKDGMSKDDYVDAVYKRRGGNFGSSTASVRGSVKNRFVEEAGVIHGMLKDNDQVGSVSTLGGGIISPDKAMALQGKLDSAKRTRLKQAGFTTENFSNRIAYGMDTGDFSEAAKDVQSLQNLGFQDEALKMASQLQLAQTAYSALDTVRDLPLAEQAKEAHNRLQALVKPENAKSVIDMRNHVDRAIEHRIKAFIDDPAAYVSALPEMQEPHLNEQDRILHSLQLQEEKAKGLGVAFIPQILGREQAKQLKQGYDNLKEPLQRALWLRQQSAVYGGYTAEILREMKVPDTVALLLPTMNALSDKTLGTFMHAIETKPSDIAGDKDWKDAAKDIKSEVLDTVQGLARTFSGNPTMRAMADKLQETYTKFVLLGGNIEELENAFDAYGNEKDKCFLLLPRDKKISASDLASRANEKREEIRDQLIKEVPQPKTQQGRIDISNIIGKYDNGIFVTDESANNVVLIDAQTGHPISHNGQIMSFSIDELMKRPAPTPKIYFGE